MDTRTRERFWSKVDKTGECWEWKAAKSEKGYGLFKFQGKQWRAHRFSWFVEHGPIPPAAQVNHHCDNPACVNPAHLYLGSQLDNRRDAVKRKRTAKGKRSGSYRNRGRSRSGANGNAKLSSAEISRMVHDYLSSERSALEVGALYGVTDATVLYHVRRRRGANPKSQRRLDSLQIAEIVRRYEAGESAIKLGEAFGVTNGAVYWHVHRARRRH